MTQQPLTWLIKAPVEGPTFNELLILACRGNDKIATLLYELLYEGACVASRQNLNLSTLEFVRLNLNLDQIVKGLDHLHKHASKQSILNWRKKLQSWGFVQVDGHRHRYDIYFHKIEEAMKSPPAKEVTPRGRYAHKRDSSVENERFKRGESSLERDSSVDTAEEIQFLRSHISKVESQMSNLEFEISKVESLFSHERACREALEAKVDALYNLSTINDNYNLKERKKEEPPTSSQATDSFIHSSNNDINLTRRLNSSGDVTLPPASVGGVSIPPSNLANAPQGENAEPPDNVAVLNTPPQSVIPNATFPIDISTDKTGVGAQDNSEVGKGGYTKDYDHVDSDHDDSDQVDSDVPMEESCMVTRKILLDWVTKAGVALGLPASCEKAVAVLLPLVKCEKDVIDLVKIERKRHPSGVIYVSNLANPVVISEYQRIRESQPTPDKVPAYMGMSRAEFDEVGRDIQSVGLIIACGQSEETGRYFIGIADSDDTQININRPDDWWHLPMEAVQRAWNYAHPPTIAVVHEEIEQQEAVVA